MLQQVLQILSPSKQQALILCCNTVQKVWIGLDPTGRNIGILGEHPATSVKGGTVSAHIRGRTDRVSEYEHRDISQNVKQQCVAKAAVMNSLNLEGRENMEREG